MKRIKIFFLSGNALLSFTSPVLAFTGNSPHTQTLIVSSQILDDDGKLVDPESNAEANKDTFTLTVHFSNLQKDDEIEYSYGDIRPEKDGTAEVTWQTGNCAPRYFDHVPVTAKIVVTEAATNYLVSCQTYDFVHDVKDSTEKVHTALTTQELQLKDGKDGFVLFSNKKDKAITGIMIMQKNLWIIVILIPVFLITEILLYRRKRSEILE